MGFVTGLFVRGDEIVYSNMNYIAVDRVDEVIVLFHWDVICRHHLLFCFQLFLLLDRIRLTLQYRFYPLCRFHRFLLFGLFESVHCRRHLHGSGDVLFAGDYCDLAPLDSFLLGFGWLFRRDFYCFRVKICVLENHLLLVFAFIPVS